MTGGKLIRPRVLELSTAIERDIDERGLKPGDRYHSTATVAKELGVSRQAANAALQLLSQRGRLVRKQRLGAFVADPSICGLEQPIQSLLVLVHPQYLRTEGLMADGVTLGIASRLPAVNIDFSYVPRIEETGVVEKLVRRCRREKVPTGLLLVRSSLSTQRIVEQSGLPAVIYGTPQPSIQALSSLDTDQEQAGELLAEDALSRGAERLVVLMRDYVHAGDHKFQAGIRKVLSQRGLGVDAICYLHLAADDEAIFWGTKELLEQDSRRTAVIARTERLAAGAARAAEHLGLSVGDELPVSVSVVYRRAGGEPPSFPHIRSTADSEKIGWKLADLLCTAAGDGGVIHHKLAVELQQSIKNVFSS